MTFEEPLTRTVAPSPLFVCQMIQLRQGSFVSSVLDDLMVDTELTLLSKAPHASSG